MSDWSETHAPRESVVDEINRLKLELTQKGKEAENLQAKVGLEESKCRSMNEMLRQKDREIAELRRWVDKLISKL